MQGSERLQEHAPRATLLVGNMCAAPVKVKALADLKGAEAGELSFKEGEVFVLLERGSRDAAASAAAAAADADGVLLDQSGWAKGLLHDKKGWFPWDYVEQLPPDAAPASEFLTWRCKPTLKPPAVQVAAEPKPAPAEPARAPGAAAASAVGDKSPRKKVVVQPLKSVEASKSEQQVVSPKPVEQPAPPVSGRASRAAVDQSLSPRTSASTSSSNLSKLGEACAALCVSAALAQFLAAAPPLAGQHVVLTSSKNASAESRKVQVTIVKKDPAPALSEESVFSAFLNDAKKHDLYSSVLLANPAVPAKYYPSALELYDAYLDEMAKALKAINNRERQGIAAPTSTADPHHPANQRKLLGVFRNFVVSVGSRERLGFGLAEALDMVLYLVRLLKLPTTVASKDDKKAKTKDADQDSKDTALVRFQSWAVGCWAQPLCSRTFCSALWWSCCACARTTWPPC